MLQPRKRKFTLKITPKGLLLCIIILLTFTQNVDYVKGEDERNGLIKEKIKRGERVIRHGDVNIVVLDDFDRRKFTPSLGLLSTTARTFIQEGTTTEYATHIYGTTVGEKYAHIVSTGSKIFYDNVRPSKEKFESTLVLPSLDSLIHPSEDNAINYIAPTKVTKHKNPMENPSVGGYAGGINHEDNARKNFDSLKPNVPSIAEKLALTLIKPGNEEKKANYVSIKKEISIKPAKVKLKNELPTFTVNKDTSDVESRAALSAQYHVDQDNNVRAAKNAPHKSIDKTPDFTTTTYFGFADFVTTAGNTVIIFTPNTKKQNEGAAITSIYGEPTIENRATFSTAYSSTAIANASFSTNIKSESEPTTEITNDGYEIETTTLDKNTINTDEQLSTEARLAQTTTEAQEVTTEIQDATTEPLTTELTTENVVFSFEAADDLVKKYSDVPFKEISTVALESSFAQDEINPTSASDIYKTLTYVTTFYLSSQDGQIVTSVKSNTVVLNSLSTDSNDVESTTLQTETTEMERETTENEDSEDFSTTSSASNLVELGLSESDVGVENDNSHNAFGMITTIANTDDRHVPGNDTYSDNATDFVDDINDDAHVELIFKTLYTTYTYLTTYFEKSTTRVKSREEVITSIVTSTFDTAFLQLATDPAVATLFSDNIPGSRREGKLLPSTFAASSDTDSEITKPTPSLDLKLAATVGDGTKYASHSSFSTTVGNEKSLSATNSSDIGSNFEQRQSTSEERKNEETSARPKSVVLKHVPVNSYKTTIKRVKSTGTKSENNVLETKIARKNDTEFTAEEVTRGPVIISAPLTNDASLISTRKSTEQTPKKVYLENDSEDDQLSQESNTEETHPNPSLISLQTSYTTYTYFTTLYKGSTSEVVSRLETVTNVNTELIRPSTNEIDVTDTVPVEEAVVPITFYTTYTYWTTFYKDGSTMIKSRQETVSNVAFPMQTQTQTPMPTPTQTQTQTLPTVLTSISVADSIPTDVINSTATPESFVEPVTYYTTFTYFTTSYIGNSSMVNSHLETVTNVVETSKMADFSGTTRENSIFQSTNIINDTIADIALKRPTIKNEKNSTTTTNANDDAKPTGIVSINAGIVVDAFNVSTTQYTTKILGTYIEQLYAQLIESTSTIRVNTEQLTNLINPSTTVLGDKTYQTGVLQRTVGSVIKDKTTTFYENRVVGKLSHDQYVSVTEKSSSVSIEITPTKTADVAIVATTTTTTDQVPSSASVLTSTSPSPAVIESSMNDGSNDNNEAEVQEDKDNSSKRKSFTPVIRPFASRSRPTFLPKKKTSDTFGAATITRGITPTIVAIPAIKVSESRVFGNAASKNRFASNRKSSVVNSPISEVRSATPSSRRFSKNKFNPSTTSASLTSSSAQFGKTTGFKAFSSLTTSSNFKRGSYRPTLAKSVEISSSAVGGGGGGGSRFRVRPTAGGRFVASSISTTPKLDEIESSETAFTEHALLPSSNEEAFDTLSPPITTDSSSRKSNNPLLKFRKPGIIRASNSPISTVKPTTTKRNSLRKTNNDNKLTTTKAPTTAKFTKSRTPASINNRLRSKSAADIFSSKSSPKKTELLETEAKEVDDRKEIEEEELENIDEATESLEAAAAATAPISLTERSTTRNSKNLQSVSIKPFPHRRGRIKRQAEWGYKYENGRGQSSRYRRPTQNSFPDYLYYDDIEYTTEDVAVRSVNNRNIYKSRNNQQSSPIHQTYQQQSSYQQPQSQPQQQSPFQNQQTYQSTTPVQNHQSPKIRPSSVVSSTNRAQFTLRDKSQMASTSASPPRSNRRTTPASSSYRKYDGGSTTKRSSRLRGYTTTTESYRGRKQSTSRRPGRNRYKDTEYSTNAYTPTFDGIITVTHKLPTTVSIPIINGKTTEYKNVVTAKPSLQVLQPHQYTTVTGKNGAPTLQLANDVTETLFNGNVEVTRFVINELPTTSVTFTPTSIRGRKTSYSHIVTSTMYEVKPEVSTILPQLNANAPLTNLLLSQLLLGNLGIQPGINPLLGISQATVTPVTEFKTKTTSYVTTITHSTSTIIPVTFRGKEIKTTVIDSSTQIITATEYITETVVISPTQTALPANQLNTLLFPALLQAQQLFNQPQSTTSAPMTTVSQSIDENVGDNLQTIQDVPNPSKVINEKDEDYLQKDSRKKQKANKPYDSPIDPAETSVVTLYLSGRRPGEFSTVLSTVVLDEKTATLRKRNVDPSYDLKPSALPSLSSSLDYDHYNDNDRDRSSSSSSSVDEIIKSGMNDDVSPSRAVEETERLENIVGLRYGNEKKFETNHFLANTSTESAPFRWNFGSTTRSSTFKLKDIESQQLKDSFVVPLTGERIIKIRRRRRRSSNSHPEFSKSAAATAAAAAMEDEGRGRYNLATKVMSNGVEVIVALDKSTLPGSPQLLRVLPTTNIRPITLTPSTVTDHMIMMLPHGLQDTPNPLVTKTYVTTYTFLTTVLQEGETTTSSQEKVISNVLTENANIVPTNLPNANAHVTLTSSPIMATKVLQTTYKMESTVTTHDNTPYIVTTQQTVANTVTAPGADFTHLLLHPSEPILVVEPNPTTWKETINEEYTIKPTEKLNSAQPAAAAAAITDAQLKSGDYKSRVEAKFTSLQSADITKTYFVTYTYYSTLLENGTTVVKSNVATSSDIVTEKVYLPAKRTKYSSSLLKETSISAAMASATIEGEKSINIFATKTYLTTFTYFTTLLQDKGDKTPQTIIRSRTKVMQNLVTETLNPNLLNSDYLSNLKYLLKKSTLPITATATLNDGQRLEITAMNELSSSNIDRISSSLEDNQEYYHQVSNYLEANENRPAPVEFEQSIKQNMTSKGNNFTTTILRSSTSVKNDATQLSNLQVIKFTDAVGNVSLIPISDPGVKHPDGQKPETNKIQMNNLLNIGSLGINGLNALKPVISAVAGLWQNNLKSNVRDKNERTPPSPSYSNDKNPSSLSGLDTDLKPPNRTPIYIPVGSTDDNEEAESEDIVEQQQYPDINQRNNHISLSRPTMEKPLVSGGIPISPGQVITANTDVIVGTPAVLGPRPPIKHSNNEKSDVPIGMKPPPLTIASSPETMNALFGELIKLPPKPLSPAFLNANHFKLPTKNHYKYNADQKVPSSSEIKFSQLPPNVPTPFSESEIQFQPHPPAAEVIHEQTAIMAPSKLSRPVLVEHSSLNPLLVNVRPSQVAQVVIPHGSETALIYNDEPVTYSSKGEIINDPSPYPEENVNPGFVGLKVYGPEGASKLSSNTIHLDIPINPYASDGAITESHHFIVLNSEGKPQSASQFNLVNSVLKAPFLPNDTDFTIFKRPNSKYNFTTVHSNVEFVKKPDHPHVWSHLHNRPQLHLVDHKQRPFIFPQNKPTITSDQQLQADNNFSDSVLDGSNDASAVEENGVNDEITQETKLKPNSDHHRNQVLKSPIADAVAVNDHSIPDRDSEQLSDYEINQNWEITKEKPQTGSNLKPLKGEKFYSKADNSTTRENPNVKYSEWSTAHFPTFTRDANDSDYSQQEFGSTSNGSSSSSYHYNNVSQVSDQNKNNRDNLVIGLSPPPPPAHKPVWPNLKIPYEQKSPQRPTLKNKPKPTVHPPYPFEKPNPSSMVSRPRPTTTMNKPPANILYETNAPNFGDEIMKMKPLNSTGRIEPVKKWQTTTTTTATTTTPPLSSPRSTSKPASLNSIYSNVTKDGGGGLAEQKNESKPNKHISYFAVTDTSASQSDKKFASIDIPNQKNGDIFGISDKTTELISKWSENDAVSDPQNDYEDTEYKNTPILIPTNRTKATTVPNTIFGNLYTRPPPANIVIIPTHSTTQHYTAISMVIDHESGQITPSQSTDQDVTSRNGGVESTSVLNDGYDQTKDEFDKEMPTSVAESKILVTPTYHVTYTKTLSVTITQTTVVQRDGQPSTHTVVLTKTQTSTLIDTVTKIQTLLQPTNVLSTITTTIPVTISKVQSTHSTISPSDYPMVTDGGDDRSAEDNDSIFVVMTDKKSGTAHIAPAPTEARPTSFEVQVPDEANEISPNDILYSGIFTQHADNECRPECKMTKNEICQKMDGGMRCVCRPGFARMFPDHPCKPTYTYIMKLPLDRQGEEEIRYTDGLADRTSPSHQQLTEAARDGLDRMVMQSNLRDIYHGVVVSGFEPAKQSNKATVVYMVQLSENAEEIKLLEEVHKTLKANNFSLGGTDVFAASDLFHFIQAEDFDECNDNKYHDCSERAQCFNLRGTYTCSCKEGYTDVSYNTQFPGRICSADAIGCELCHFHGSCYYKTNEDPSCECFQWYAGEFCHVNLKVTLISLIAIGILLTILLVICVLMTCNKKKPPEILRNAPKPHVGFRRYRSVTNIPGDKRAIVSVDTSSEGSIERTPPPFIKQRVLRNVPPNAPSSHGGGARGGGTVQSAEQRDRSLTVLIPRAKYRPVPSQPSSTLLTMSTFGPEQKMLNYAGSRESSRTPEKKMSRCSLHSRRLSNSTNLSAEPQPRKKSSAPRRPSNGALVSAGFEVSATVRRTQELDEAYISQSHNDLNQPTYNSIRTVESSIMADGPSLPMFESSLDDFITRVDKLGTVSEARSYDETTIQPPMRSLHHVFHSQAALTCGSKNSSSQKTNLDEHHTMGERDLGSTYMPKSQLYKPDHRESDGSNFDSL